MKVFLLLVLLCHLGNAEEKENSSETSSQSNEESNELHAFGRIIGGQTAKPGQYPFVARLRMNYGRYASLCSGTVLSNRIILTAAHCVTSGGIKPKEVLATVNGKSYIFHQNELFPNKEYNDKFSDDIAILKLGSNKQPMTDYGRPPLLHSTISKKGQLPAIVAGWGKTSDRGQVSTTLQYASVSTISDSLCGWFFGSIITEKTICTLDLGKGICGGDSGGPLMITNGGNQYVIGVNAFGSSVCESFAPSGYTYVPAFSKWLNSVIN